MKTPTAIIDSSLIEQLANDQSVSSSAQSQQSRRATKKRVALKKFLYGKTGVLRHRVTGAQITKGCTLRKDNTLRILPEMSESSNEQSHHSGITSSEMNAFEFQEVGNASAFLFEACESSPKNIDFSKLPVQEKINMNSYPAYFNTRTLPKPSFKAVAPSDNTSEIKFFFGASAPKASL